MNFFLLDTHTFLWLVTGDKQLSTFARQCFLDINNQFYLSAVTGFEIAVKYSLGKLQLTEPPKKFITHHVQANGLIPLPVTIEHTLYLEDLPFHHRDPFDRLLVAQALAENIPILSADKILSEYPIQRVW